MDQSGLKPILIENGQRFTHFLAQFLVFYDYLVDVKGITGRRSGPLKKFVDRKVVGVRVTLRAPVSA
jgi:hypothetical protein